MRTGPVLTSDLVDKYQPLGAFGQPVHLSYVQLRATVLQKLGPRYANYFSRPDRDENTKQLHWIADVPGQATRWADLSPEHQARFALDLHVMRSEFQAYLGELRRQGDAAAGKGAAAFASLLEQALLVPDDSHLFFVGDQPVVSFWGFQAFDKQAIDPLATAPRRPPAAAAEVPPHEATAAVSEMGISLPFRPRRKPWWRWLLWALALLLLLLLLLFGLSRCFPDDVQLPLFGAGGERLQPIGPDGVVPPADGAEGLIERTLRTLGLGGAAPGGTVPDGTAPDGSLPGGPDQTAPASPPENGTPPGDHEPDAATPGAEKPEDQAKPRAPDADKSDAQKPDAQKPDAQKPDAGKPAPRTPSEPPTHDEAKPNTPDKGAYGQPLQIPPDASASGTAGFLGGEWRTDTGLVDQATKQPLQQTYRFDDKGKGEVVIRRPDGSECKAAAQASMQGGKLAIDEQGMPTCPDGKTFSPSKTECARTPSGQTVCTGRNADGSTYRVGIERQATP
ncbi:MAG: hypothetical protein IPK66_07160 [Rhodospirillales bacterium]|nr:hypothetical protein [Rhodospirillales bacterium]